jgi:predicted RNA-binding protein YlqC (UPF0109 family)
VVNNPDQVRLEITEGASMIVLELSVDPDDMGRVIGKKEQIAVRRNAHLPALQRSSKW